MTENKKRLNKAIHRGIYKMIASEESSRKGKEVRWEAVRQAIFRGHIELTKRYTEILLERKAEKERVAQAFEKAIAEVS